VPTGSYRHGQAPARRRAPRSPETDPTVSHSPDQLPEDLTSGSEAAGETSGQASGTPGDAGANDSWAGAAGIDGKDDVDRPDDHDEDEADNDADGDRHERFMSIGDHLEELRVRFFWMLGIIGVLSGAAGLFSADLHRLLIGPYQSLTGERLILQNVYGGMEIYIKVSVLAGVIVGFPALVFILWGFITPAVSRRVAYYGHFAVACSALLFWAGITFCWFYIFPMSLQFLFVGMQLESVAPVMAVERYYSFLFVLHIATGLAFQLPIILVALGAFGILTVDWHRRTWKYALLVIYAFAAIITPPDPWSMLAVGTLLLLLYSLSIGVVWILERTRRKKVA
jgi:sec-independent protein translocase protein TatC